MNLNTPNRRKLTKLNTEIEQLEKNIEESKKKLATLKAAKLEAENAEIISLVRNADLSVDDIADLISGLCVSKSVEVQSTAAEKNYPDNNISKGSIVR